MPTILVTGGTGDLGSKLVERFAASGYTVRVLSRRPRPTDATTEWAQGDVETGAGLGRGRRGRRHRRARGDGRRDAREGRRSGHA